MKKNVAGQVIGAEMITAADGSAFTGTVTVYVTGDGGTQAIGSVGSGICTHEGNGYHTYAPAQSETNYDLIAFTFTGSGAIPATVQVFTTYPQSGDSYAEVTSGTYGLSILEGLVDDLESRLGTPSDLGSGASVAANLVDIEAQTDDIGAAGAGLTAIPWNAAWDAQVESEVTDALGIYDSPTKAEMDSGFAGLNDPTAAAIADAVWDEAKSGHTAGGSFGEEVQAHALSSEISALNDISAADVWGYGTRALTDKAGFSISGTKQTLDALNDLSAAQVNTEVDTALNTAIPGSPTADSINERIKAIDDKLPSGTISDFDESSNQVTVATNNDKTGYSIGTGGIGASSFAAGAIDAAATAADFLTEIVHGILDHDYTDHNSTDTVGEVLNDLGPSAKMIIVSTVAEDAGNSTTQFKTNLTEATNDHYNGRNVIFRSGALIGQASDITDYDGGSKIIYVTALTEEPTAGAEFEII